jgi:type II secretory pathway pseudopilin PulG
MRGAQRGFTYLGLLLAIAVLGLALVAASEVWVTTAKRQRLVELEWVGSQYVQAIGSYYESSPGGAKRFPKSIDDLLEDRRVPYARRHLRQAYVNPLTGKNDWELIVAPGGGFVGVRARESTNSEQGEVAAAREFLYVPLAGAR